MSGSTVKRECPAVKLEHLFSSISITFCVLVKCLWDFIGLLFETAAWIYGKQLPRLIHNVNNSCLFYLKIKNTTFIQNEEEKKRIAQKCSSAPDILLLIFLLLQPEHLSRSSFHDQRLLSLR